MMVKKDQEHCDTQAKVSVRVSLSAAYVWLFSQLRMLHIAAAGVSRAT
jgi:hypothetical protein